MKAPRSRTTRPLVSLLAALALGCGTEDEPPGSNPDPACRGEPYTFSITDETNYRFDGTLDIEMSTLKDATDVRFDWSGLTRDFFGKPVDPAEDIDMVLISLWELTPGELTETLNRDALERRASHGAIMTYPDGSFTSQNLLSFGILGHPLPDEDEIWSRFDTNHPDFHYPQDQYTFLLIASTGTSIGKGGRMLSMFNLDPESTQTELVLTDDSTTLTHSVDLERAEPVRVPAGQPSLTIDWSEMTVNALGNEYLPTQITEAVVAYYADATVSDLEDDFLYLEETADGWWQGEVTSGTSIDLGTLTDENGATFPGIDTTGTWLVALSCTVSCNNPAPWSITILSACE